MSAPAIPPRDQWVPYTFHRTIEGEPVFYVVDLPADAILADHAECNPGTTRIDDAITGETLWRQQ